LYFALLEGVSAVEVVANRVIWSLVFLLLLTAVTRTWRRTLAAARQARHVGMLGLAAAFLALNWGVYVYAVLTNQVVEASLGYFINPLVSVGLGVIVLRERLRPGQWWAVGIAIAAVGVLAVSYGRLPWISLILAFSFGIYGLLKKQVGVGSVESLTIETAVLAPFALAVMVLAARDGASALTSGEPDLTLLLILLGPITAIPLLAFGGARSARILEITALDFRDCLRSEGDAAKRISEACATIEISGTATKLNHSLVLRVDHGCLLAE
jgi:chloramphenicol-sensitive protein RarD